MILYSTRTYFSGSGDKWYTLPLLHQLFHQPLLEQNRNYRMITKIEITGW